MKKLYLIASMLCSSLLSSAQFSTATDIDDLALIYIGSQHRPDWNKELFEPYVAHSYADGTKSWMFDGFLMIEFLAYNELGQQVSFGESVASVQGSKRSDWERLLREQLGTESGYGCRALDNLIDDLIPELGEPGHKHKVVFTLPVAEDKSDLWGEIDGKTLNFTRLEDRIEGMKWYADLLEREWNKAGFKHLEFDGVYWTCESFYSTNQKMVLDVNEYYHEKGLNVYWIPYLSRYLEDSYKGTDQYEDLKPTQAADKWEEMNIDVTYIQPNYYFQSYRSKKFLEDAINYAWDHDGMGMELEFEGYNYGWTFDPNTKTGTRYRMTPGNCVLYGIYPTFYQRLVDYVDYFEDMDVFGFMPVAYYSGFQGFYDLEKSGNPKDMEISHRIANILNRRHVESGWDQEPRDVAGIDDVTLENRVLAYGLDGAIYIADAAGDASIYSLDGKLVYAADAERLSFGATVACEPGVYIVRVGSRSVKVSVK